MKAIRYALRDLPMLDCGLPQFSRDVTRGFIAEHHMIILRVLLLYLTRVCSPLR